jgi:hypothetical protein
MRYPPQKTREKLRDEYHRLPRHSNKMKWCNDNAVKLRMSYGKFVRWLGV